MYIIASQGKVIHTRYILSKLVSDTSPANLLPVPSKHSTNCFLGGAGPMAVMMYNFEVFFT